MSETRDSTQWYLEVVGGSRAGPFTREQLESLKSQGKISDRQRVISTAKNAEWTTVGKILGSTPEATKSFSPPPRPDIEKTHAGPNVTDGPSKIFSVAALYDTLQEAKERKPRSDSAPPPPLIETRTSPTSGNSRTVAVSVALVIVIAAVVYALQDKPAQTTDPRTKRETAETKPVSQEQPKAHAPAPQPAHAAPPPRLPALRREAPRAVAPASAPEHPRPAPPQDDRDSDRSEDSRDSRDARDSRDYRDTRDSRDRDSRDSRDSRDRSGEAAVPQVQNESGHEPPADRGLKSGRHQENQQDGGPGGNNSDEAPQPAVPPPPVFE